LESKTLKKIRFTASTAASVAICLASLASQAHATVFKADGFFSDGASLGGTLTVDTTLGEVTESDLTIAGAGIFSTIEFQSSFGPVLGYSVVVDNVAGTEEFSFGLLTDTLVGYAGGDLCSDSSVGCFSSNYYPIVSPFDGVSLSSGRLIGESAAVPEPAALSCVSTFFALFLVFCHWFRNRNHSCVKGLDRP
jgi:hypothetical protein